MRTERLKADLILLFVAIVWGSAFVAQRVAAVSVGAFLFNGFRFLAGAILLLPLLRRNFLSRNSISRNPGQRVESRRNTWGVLLVGFLIFAGAAFQQLGMRFTTASNAGFITGLYVVLVPLFLAAGWGQRPPLSKWLASLLAALGLFLLSTGGRLVLNPGDILEFAGAGVWALHVIFISSLVQRLDVLRLAIGQYLVCGLLSLAAGFVFEFRTLPALGPIWWTVAYTGLFSIGVGYTLQVYGQRVAPPADAAIILSLEAVFAALFGWWILGERLSAVQLLGCAFMLGGMLFAQIQTLERVPT